jgi:SOS response associated peptidase (SRAP)
MVSAELRGLSNTHCAQLVAGPSPLPNSCMPPSFKPFDSHARRQAEPVQVLAAARTLTGRPQPRAPPLSTLYSCHYLCPLRAGVDGADHDRMPVILGSEDWEKWLGEEPANDNELKAMLKPFASERRTTWPVSRSVGNVKNDGPDLIEHAPIQDSLL